MKDIHVISHEGTVVHVGAKHVQVKIISVSACATCHAKKSCLAADMSEKIIDAIPLEPLKQGDSVIIKMKEKLGWIALFYGYILPLIILAAVLFTLPALGFSENIAGLMAIGSLVPYYLVLYMSRKKMEKVFVFTAEKINTIETYK